MPNIQPNPIKKKSKPRQTGRGKGVIQKKVTRADTLLPAWVIGAYDGPSNGKLSSREGVGADHVS